MCLKDVLDSWNHVYKCWYMFLVCFVKSGILSMEVEVDRFCVGEDDEKTDTSKPVRLEILQFEIL